MIAVVRRQEAGINCACLCTIEHALLVQIGSEHQPIIYTIEAHTSNADLVKKNLIAFSKEELCSVYHLELFYIWRGNTL